MCVLAGMIGVTSFRYNIFDHFMVLIYMIVGDGGDKIISKLLYGPENRILIYMGNCTPHLITLFVIRIIDFFASDNSPNKDICSGSEEGLEEAEEEYQEVSNDDYDDEDEDDSSQIGDFISVKGSIVYYTPGWSQEPDLIRKKSDVRSVMKI